jgi:hypothetical protein
VSGCVCGTFTETKRGKEKQSRYLEVQLIKGIVDAVGILLFLFIEMVVEELVHQPTSRRRVCAHLGLRAAQASQQSSVTFPFKDEKNAVTHHEGLHVVLVFVDVGVVASVIFASAFLLLGHHHELLHGGLEGLHRQWHRLSLNCTLAHPPCKPCALQGRDCACVQAHQGSGRSWPWIGKTCPDPSVR